MPPHVDVTWVALECRQKQEASDEVFGTVSASNRLDGQPNTHPFPGDRTFFEMGEPGERIVTVAVPLYSGPPEALDVTVTLVERDGDEAINGYKKRVADAVAQAAGQVVGAFTSGASAAAQPIIDGLARALVDEASDLLVLATIHISRETST